MSGYQTTNITILVSIHSPSDTRFLKTTKADLGKTLVTAASQDIKYDMFLVLLDSGIGQQCHRSLGLSLTAHSNLHKLRPKAMSSIADKIVICIIGGPGVGKGTQSALIRKNYDVGYMSAGDLLRKAAAEDTPAGRQLAEQLRKGEIVAQEITFGLLKAEIQGQKKDIYLIDGFPRKVEQADAFSKTVVRPKAVLFLDAPDDVLVERLMGRATSSGRSDDNPDSIRLRLKVFHEISYPVVEYFGDIAYTIDSNRSIEAIWADIKAIIDRLLEGPK
jgi:adenylate kinase family enzyme